MVSKTINDAMPISVINSVVSDIKSLLLELSGGSCHFISVRKTEVAYMLAQESITFIGDKSWLYECPPCIRKCTLADVLMT